MRSGTSTPAVKKVISRLKRANGQVAGLIKMLEAGEDCDKIIVQFQASKAALDGAFSELLSDNLEQCLTKKDNTQIKKIIKLIVKK